MYIYQHSHDLQPATDQNENVDCTSASHLCTNLHEMPSFISTHKQLQLLVYNTVKQSNNPTPLYMIVSGTAGARKSKKIV